MLTGNDSGAGDGHSGWIQRRQEVDTSHAGGRETQGTDGQDGPRGWQGRGMDVGALSEMKKPEEQLPGHLEGRGCLLPSWRTVLGRCVCQEALRPARSLSRRIRECSFLKLGFWTTARSKTTSSVGLAEWVSRPVWSSCCGRRRQRRVLPRERAAD